jgi:hypothetical protein
MKIQLFVIILFCFFFCGCNNTRKKQLEIEVVVEKEKTISNEEPQRKFDPDQPSKVITYVEIEQELKHYREYHLAMYKDTAEINKILVELSDYFNNMLISELRLLRNEFFARKEYIFKSADLDEYFLRKRWYNPRYSSIDSIILSKEELRIIDSIIFYEHKNRTLTESALKNRMKDSLNNSKLIESFGEVYYQNPPVVLFRRYLGYQIANKENSIFRKDEMYSFPDCQLHVIDTINNILAMSFVRMYSCPAEWCLYRGELFTCGMNFELIIDSRPIDYNTPLYKSRREDSVICTLELPPWYSRDTSFLLIDSKGKITDYEGE